MQLSEKETSLLKDLKGQEDLCIKKYGHGAQYARDPQLRDLFAQIEKVEQNHLQTLTQIENGNVPTMSASSAQMPTFSETYGMGDTEDKQHDCYLCSDALAIEKHASHLYDTCVFEFKDNNVRNVINHIQKEEQNHGKMIYDYMSANNMYS